MRIVKISDVDHVTESAATPVPGWAGGAVSRTFQTIVPPGMSKNFKCSVVNFSRGATTGFHSHSEDQILIIISGSGIVATEAEERVVTVGDIAYCPAGEEHWHGAGKESSMSHIALTTPGSETTRAAQRSPGTDRGR
jgi:quercetin dioxygenase-like cupin family protein